MEEGGLQVHLCGREADDGKRLQAVDVVVACVWRSKGRRFGGGGAPNRAGPDPRRIFSKALNTAQACVLETFGGKLNLRCWFFFLSDSGVAFKCLWGAF